MPTLKASVLVQYLVIYVGRLYDNIRFCIFLASENDKVHELFPGVAPEISNVTDEKLNIILCQGRSVRKVSLIENLPSEFSADVETIFEERSLQIESAAVDCVEKFI